MDASNCPFWTGCPSWTRTWVRTPLIWGFRTTLLSDWTLPTAVSSKGTSLRLTRATDTRTGSGPTWGADGRTVRHRRSPPNTAMPARAAPAYAFCLRDALIAQVAREFRASFDTTQGPPSLSKPQ